ncbi:phosphatidylinositol 4-phosphatase, partial [Tremellales sp. Uapishka_1]
MPFTPHHTPKSSLSSPAGLPARFTVPPLPPRIHRQLLVTVQPDGILLRPKAADQGQSAKSAEKGVLVRWGVRGKVQAWEGEVSGDVGVELGGVLGIVRLWDAAYLMVFLLPLKPPSPLFPNHVEPSLAQGDVALDREAAASAHEVHTLGDIHAIPLVPILAEKAVSNLARLQAKRQPKKKAQTSKAGPLRWSIPFPNIQIGGPGAAAREEEQSLVDSSDEESDEQESDDDHSAAQSTLGSKSQDLISPEANETPAELPAGGSGESDSGAKKRFSMGWGRFMPKLGKPGQKAPTNQEASMDSAPLTKQNDADPVSEDLVDKMVPVVDEPAVPETTSPDSAASSTPPPFASNPPQRRDLETKILREIIREYSSGGFFYSFDFDLTHSLQYKRNLLSSRTSSGPILATLLSKGSQDRITFPPSPSIAPATESATPGPGPREDDFAEPDIQVPLWRRVDRRFFWNEHLLVDFMELGLHAYIVPVMQGWVQSSTFTLPVPPNPLEPSVSLGEVPIDLVVISRRSRERAGLRYQRRGIDDEGNVANMVETEMIVRAKVEGKVSLFSFLQVRGSIPLKWSQSPYSLKPAPVLDQPIDQAYSVANLHFNDLTAKYGPITIVNLSEQTGKEGLVTNGYEELVKSLARKDVTYVGFDFHAKCKGMKWENIAELVEELDFNDMGYLWTLQGDAIREQQGAFRTNCIDCLDRTNVVQSALARKVLSTMLTQLGLIADQSTSPIESVFNDTWANNGDMLSFCYAHTSALKGDFVRTGKRDFSGMLHDGVSSISRMFYGAVSDFFAQAVISFMLGHRNLSVFSEFLETLQSSDASSLIKLSRVRAAAVETCSSRVLNSGETRIAGWTLLSPEERNVKISPKLEEKVLLLTKLAVYVVSFNYPLEKVIGFTRIPLGSITSIQKGAYILSPLQEASRDPDENAGFVINFSPIDESTRFSTYSIRNKPSSSPASPSKPPSTPGMDVEHSSVNPLGGEYFAFKALPREFIARGASTVVEDSDDEVDLGAQTGESCLAVVDRLVKRVQEQCKKAGHGHEDGFVVPKDIVSLAEAQSATSLLARMDYAVKRFLWL